MIETRHILSKDRYKKFTPHTGSETGMRYRIWRVKGEELDDLKEPFHVAVWPEPLSYECTAEDLIEEKIIPYTDEGYEEILTYLNERSSAYPLYGGLT